MRLRGTEYGDHAGQRCVCTGAPVHGFGGEPDGIEAVALGDICDGGTRFSALLDDLGFEGFATGTTLRMHEKSA